jgi:phage anti-repressor protein
MMWKFVDELRNYAKLISLERINFIQQIEAQYFITITHNINRITWRNNVMYLTKGNFVDTRTELRKGSHNMEHNMSDRLYLNH